MKKTLLAVVVLVTSVSFNVAMAEGDSSADAQAGAISESQNIAIGMMGGNATDAKYLLAAKAHYGDKEVSDRIASKIQNSFNNLNEVAATVATQQAVIAGLREDLDAAHQALGSHRQGPNGAWSKPVVGSDSYAITSTQRHTPVQASNKSTPNWWN
jgi:hypothetical protein